MTTYLQEIFAGAVWWLTKLYMMFISDGNLSELRAFYGFDKTYFVHGWSESGIISY